MWVDHLLSYLLICSAAPPSDCLASLRITRQPLVTPVFLNPFLHKEYTDTFKISYDTYLIFDNNNVIFIFRQTLIFSVM